ncbi:MAG: Glutaryl-7-aminocephalosporanic-acid acylase [Bryobacterales bacterium]|nr:Glutaryl-7-aminocephalosporanic-acid acylase [Bryobacterales bacterium]
MRVLLLCLVTGLGAFGSETVEILRDNFGTPHIFARTSAAAAYAAGYAQAQDRKDALLRNLRGAGTEETPLSPRMKVIVEAYCSGINRYLAENPGSDSAPITPSMVAAFSRLAFTTIHGSNDALIGPTRSSTGNVIAILDPLSGWNDDGRPYEMRIYASDEQLALSGIAPPGVPFPLIGHNASVAIGWSGSTEVAGPGALEQAWAMITARNLAEVQAALRMGHIPGTALVGTAHGELYDSSGRKPDQGVLLQARSVAQAEAGVRQVLAAQNTWPFGRAVDVAFSTVVYKAETWQARLVKVAPELPLVRMLTGWNRRSDAGSREALAFYLFKMALGQPEAAAIEPPDSLSNNRIRAALRKAQDQIETELPYRADYGTLFRVARDGAAQSKPVGGGTVPEAGMITPRAITFQRAGVVEMGTGGQTATQIVELSTAPHAVSVLIPGESDGPESGHFDDQARELFSTGTAKPTYFGDRKALEKHLSAKKELVF